MEAGVDGATPMSANAQGSLGEEGGGGSSEWGGKSAVYRGKAAEVRRLKNVGGVSSTFDRIA
jgi:hypothetical protein